MDLSAAQLADRQRIVEVIDRYASALDAKDYARFRTCFSADAAVHYGETVLRGPDAVAEYCAASLARWGATQHLLGNYEIALDGDRASARTAMHASHVSPDGGEIWVVGGAYVDRLERRDGDWMIVERSLEAKWSERRAITA